MSRQLFIMIGAALLGCSAPSVSFAEDAPAQTFSIENGALKLPAPVLYEMASDKLKPESDKALDHVSAYLKAKDYITLMRVEVHTDSDGDAAKNQQLSMKRAMAASKALVARGIDCKRLIPVGFGSSKPVAANDTAENKALNRRTMFVNAALKGHPIGGMPVDGGGQVAGDPCN